VRDDGLTSNDPNSHDAVPPNTADRPRPLSGAP